MRRIYHTAAKKALDSIDIRKCNADDFKMMIQCYYNCGLHKNAITIFRSMYSAGCHPYLETLSILLNVFKRADEWLVRIEKLLERVIELIGGYLYPFMQNNILDNFFKSGNYGGGIAFFKAIDSKSLINWNTFITSLVVHGMVVQCFDVF